MNGTTGEKKTQPKQSATARIVLETETCKELNPSALCWHWRESWGGITEEGEEGSDARQWAEEAVSTERGWAL